MHLVIDSGNTRIKIGLFKDHELIHAEAVLVSQLPETLRSLTLKNGSMPAILSDVSGSLGDLAWEGPLVRLDQDTKLPYKNLYHTPQTLGADRKALVAGAQFFFPNQTCLVIDAGTCVTYDVLTASQEYQGGAISPGLQMRLKAMHTFTGKLPLAEMIDTVPLAGLDTASCLLSGSLYGMTGEIEGFISSYTAVFGPMQVLLTGGDAPLLAKHLKTGIFVHEHLLLFGLHHILNTHAH